MFRLRVNLTRYFQYLQQNTPFYTIVKRALDQSCYRFTADFSCVQPCENVLYLNGDFFCLIICLLAIKNPPLGRAYFLCKIIYQLPSIILSPDLTNLDFPRLFLYSSQAFCACALFLLYAPGSIADFMSSKPIIIQ